ncbi:MAG: type II secretion system protein GspJ, partial [Candidatus Binatia bacterium]
DESTPYFVGRVDGMSFVSAAPQGRGGTGLAAVTYRVADDQLVLEERAVFTPSELYDPPRDAHVERAVLLTGFSAIRFEYLPHEDTDMTWQSKWDAREEDMMPAAVRMTVDGLEFFRLRPWVREVPLMTIAYGWGNDEFAEPPDEDEDESENENATTGDADESDDGDAD